MACFVAVQIHTVQCDGDSISRIFDFLIFQNFDKYKAASGTLIRDYLPIIDEATCKKSIGSANYSIQICAGGERGKNHSFQAPILYFKFSTNFSGLDKMF